MMDALRFLTRLKSGELPAVTHLMGEDLWIRHLVRKRIVEVWCGEDEVSFDRFVGTQAVSELQRCFGSVSLFSSRKVTVLSDPDPGEKGTPLSQLGKNQLAELVRACRSLPEETDRLVIETATLKKNSGVLKSLAGAAVTVDVSPPKGKERSRWIGLIAKRTRVRLSPELLEALSATETSLGTIVADLEKLALAVEEGEEVSVQLWRELTQASPEVSIWELGDFLSQGRTAEVFKTLNNLRAEGNGIHDLLPALFNWNQQRLQIRSNQLQGDSSPPKGIHPFVLKKVGARLGRVSTDRLRIESRLLYDLDRVSKQSLENPEIALEKTLVSFAEKKV